MHGSEALNTAVMITKVSTLRREHRVGGLESKVDTTDWISGAGSRSAERSRDLIVLVTTDGTLSSQA